MILELSKQVSSLESSLRLKELGCPQDSLFYWRYWEEDTGESGYVISIIKGEFSAYTTAELGDFLPGNIRGFYFKYQKEDHKFHDVGYWELGHEDERRFEHFTGHTEAEARAKMLIYLLENKLMEVPK